MRSLIRCILVLLTLNILILLGPSIGGLNFTMCAQEGNSVSLEEILEKKYVSKWLTCGPFPVVSRRSRTDHLADRGGEANINPRAGMSHDSRVASGGKVVWTEYYTESDMLYFDDIFPGRDMRVFYLAAYISADKLKSVFLRVNSRAFPEIWVNHKALNMSGSGYLVPLGPGENLILLKFRDILRISYDGRSQQEIRRGTQLSFNRMHTLDESSLSFTDIYATPFFKGSHRDLHLETELLLYNGGSLPVTDIRVAVNTDGSETRRAQTIPVLAEGGKLIVKSDVPLSQGDIGNEISVYISVSERDRVKEIDSRIKVETEPEQSGTIYYVPGFHADPVWLEDQRDYMVSLLGSTKQNLDIAVADDGYGVYLSELSYLKPFYDFYPEYRDQILRMIRSDKIGTGGAYNQGVEKLVGGEGFIKNILYGKMFHEKVLGDNPNVYNCWDVFGHIAQLPQILNKTRNIGVVWSKGIVGVDPVFWHQGLDGSKILTKRVPYGMFAQNINDLRHNVYENFKEQESLRLSTDIRFDAGDFKAPTGFFVGNTELLKSSIPSIVITGSGGRQYFNELHKEIKKKELDIPVSARDITYYHQGTGLSRINFKQANRIGENVLLQAERFGSIANYLGAHYPDVALDKAWRQLLFGQHHDALTGSICDRSYLDLMQGYREAIDLGTEARDEALRYIGRAINIKDLPTPESIPLIVFNPLAWNRTDVVKAKIEFLKAVSGFTIMDNKGAEVPFQIESIQNDGSIISSANIVFIAEDMPSLGYRTYSIIPGSDLPVEKTIQDGTVIENEIFRIEVDLEKGGGIIRLFDKESNKEIINPGEKPGNEIIAISENSSRQESPWEVYTTGKMAYSRDYDAEVSVEKGPVYSRLKVTGEMKDCKRVQEIILYKGIRRIDFITYIIDYDGKHDLFVVTFPNNLKNSIPVFEERFGAVTRKKSKGYLDHRTWQWRNYSGTAVRAAYQWMDYNYSGLLEFIDDRGNRQSSCALGMISLISSHDLVARREVYKLQETFVKKGITSTPWFDDNDRPRRAKLPYEDNTRPDDFNEDLFFCTSFRIAVGRLDDNEYTKSLLNRIDPQVRERFEGVVRTKGYFYLLVKEDQIPEGWPPLPVLIVAGKDDQNLRKAVERLVKDFEEDAVISLPVESNAAGINEQVDDYGLAILNVGNFWNSIESDGSLMIGLMHTASWGGTPWGKDRLDFWLVPEWKTHVFPYALYPHSGSWRDAEVYRRGFEYNNPLIPVQTDKHEGFLPDELSFVTIESKSCVLTTLKPVGNPTASLTDKTNDVSNRMTVRLYEATGYPDEVKIKFFKPITDAWKANILEEKEKDVAVREGILREKISSFSIETYGIVIKGIKDPLPPESLGSEREPAQPVTLRFWDENRGAAPLGYAPVNVNLSGDIITGIHIHQGGWSINKINVGITNDYTNRRVTGKVRLIVPDGWKITPSEIHYDLEPNSYVIEEVVLAFLSRQNRTGIIYAQLEHDGQIFQDALEVGEDFNLEMNVKSNAESITAIVRNPTSQYISGELALISPLETWQNIGDFSLMDILPRSFAFHMRPNSEESFTFRVESRVNIDSKNPFWSIAKLMYNGKIIYKPVNSISDIKEEKNIFERFIEDIEDFFE